MNKIAKYRTTKTCINCKTQKEADIIGKWTEELKLGNRAGNFNRAGKNGIYIGLDDGCWDNQDWYKEHGYKIIQASDLINSTPKYYIY